MIERAGHRYQIVDDFSAGLVNLARLDIQHLPDEAWDRYDSPFEAKLTLRDKRDVPSGVAGVLRKLESNDWIEDVSRMFGAELVVDRWRHYAGVFRYLPGDHLGVHVDAGIHPVSRLRKHVTAVLYLDGDGALELWRGTSCAGRLSPHPDRTCGTLCDHTADDWTRYEEPRLIDDAAHPNGPADAIDPVLGRLVLFENNDYAWHAAARNNGDHDRIVITVSYLSGEVDRWANRRERAFFVPRPNEEWDPETYRLRDLRADPERYAEAYRG